MARFPTKVNDVDFITISFLDDDDLQTIRTVNQYFRSLCERVFKTKLATLIDFPQESLGIDTGEYFLAYWRFYNIQKDMVKRLYDSYWSPQSSGPDEDPIVMCACRFCYRKILKEWLGRGEEMYYYHVKFSLSTIDRIHDLIGELYPRCFSYFISQICEYGSETLNQSISRLYKRKN